MDEELEGAKENITDVGGRVSKTEEDISYLGSGLSNAQKEITSIDKAVGKANNEVAGVKQDVAGAKSDIAGVRDDVAGAAALINQVREMVIQVNAWIKTGKLGEDENSVPFYGVEIGQQTQNDGLVVFQKFARLLSDRLSFFDRNGLEVSFIGDETMYITKADVKELKSSYVTTRTINLGDYVLTSGADGHLTLS